jgi:hypothetical protein
MREGPDHRLGRAAAVAALLIVAAAVWIVLDRTEDRPGWLTAETPGTAVIGRPFEVRITLENPVEPSQIDCTLHRANADKKDWGFLASSGPARPAAGGRTYAFVFTVPEHADTAFAFALVFLSPSGEWAQATRAATTEYVPVKRDGAAGISPAPRRTQVFRYPTAAEAERTKARGIRPRGRPSIWVHPVLGALLLAAAALSVVKAVRQKPAADPEGPRERAAWLGFAVVLAACAGLELSGLAGHVAAWGRRLAHEQSLYEARTAFQKTIMAAVSAAGVGFFFLFIKAVRRPGPRRFLWWGGMGLAVYLALSFVSVLSFHAVDRVRELLWHGLSPVDAARGAGALMAFLAAFFALRSKAGRPLT